MDGTKRGEEMAITAFDGLPIVQIGWANWDSGLIFGKRIVARRNPYNYGKKTHKPGVSMEDISYLVNSSKHLKNSRYAMFKESANIAA